MVVVKKTGVLVGHGAVYEVCLFLFSNPIMKVAAAYR